MTGGQKTPLREETRPDPWAVFWRRTASVGVMGLFLSFLVGSFLMMGSDSCGPDDARLICSPRGQMTVAALPCAAAVCATVVALIVGRRQYRGGRDVWMGMFWGIATYAVVCFPIVPVLASTTR